jgi:hypothetical protein
MAENSPATHAHRPLNRDDLADNSGYNCLVARAKDKGHPLQALESGRFWSGRWKQD